MKNLRWIALSLLLSGAALAGLLAVTFTPETRAYLGRVSIAAILLALGFQAASYLCRVVRLRVLCRGLGYTVPFPALTLTLFLSLFAGSITPGQVGGEPVRIHRLSFSGLAVGDATTVVVVERVLDLVVFFSLTAAALLSLRHLWGYLAATVLYPVAAFLVLVLVLILLLIILIRHPSFMKRAVGGITTRVLDRCSRAGAGSGSVRARTVRTQVPCGTRIDHETEVFAASASRFVRADPRALGGAVLASILDWIFFFSTASALLAALALRRPFPSRSSSRASSR
jgi:uncharacterized protein (TIRG00374 family)